MEDRLEEKELRILIVEDTPTDFELIQHELRRAKISFYSKRVETAEDFIRNLRDFHPDIILSDYHLPSFNGLHALSITSKEAPDVPFILITGALGEELAVEILKSGATDYMLKDRLSKLPHVVLRALREAEEKLARRRTEEMLSASEANFRNIIEKSAESIIVVNSEGIVRFVNPAAETLFGRTAEKILGNQFGWPVKAGEIAELDFLRNGGEIRTAEMNAVETTWEGENVYLVSLHDVTEHKRTLTELEQTRLQQLRLKDEFLSHVSHELRSPITAIHQFVTILLDGLAGNLNPDQQEYLGITLKNIYQLQTMISDLLEVTRAETGKLSIEPQCISLPELIEETCSTLQKSASAKGIVLTADLRNDLPFAYVDPVRIKQILANLIDNGIKFTPENGTINVRAQVSKQDPDFLCVSVADNGCGISAEDTKKIFDRLYQKEDKISSSRKGLGLGLYICKELVSRHGGKIWVESQEDYGSTFFFTLPIFSLTGMVAPLLTPENLLKGSVALISVEIFSLKKKVFIKPGENKIVLREVQEVLKRCLLPDLDVLLPRIAHKESGDIFFLVACADQNGTEVLVRRIRGQLALCNELKKASLDYAVSSTIVGIPSERDDLPFEHLVEDVIVKIEQLVRSITEMNDRTPNSIQGGRPDA